MFPACNYLMWWQQYLAQFAVELVAITAARSWVKFGSPQWPKQLVEHKYCLVLVRGIDFNQINERSLWEGKLWWICWVLFCKIPHEEDFTVSWQGNNAHLLFAKGSSSLKAVVMFLFRKSMFYLLVRKKLHHCSRYFFSTTRWGSKLAEVICEWMFGDVQKGRWRGLAAVFLQR